MILDRPIVFIDIESTGVDPVQDRIVSFAAAILNPDGTPGKTFYSLYNPEMPIPAEATVVHHITDEMVKDAKRFADDAPLLVRALAGKDIGGYNLRRLDLPILDEEFRRAGGKLNLDGVRVIDAFRIFQIKDPRDLAAAVRKFCGREPTAAHTADGDAADTMDVFLGQVQMFEDLRAMTAEQLHDFCLDEGRKPVDVAGKLYRDADGDVRYAFGKAKDVKIRHDSGFGDWILRCSNPPFPGSTRDAIVEEFARLWPTQE